MIEMEMRIVKKSWLNFIRYLLLAIFLFLKMGDQTFDCFAQDIQFEAEVSNQQIPLGTPLQLTLTIKGTQGRQAIPLPVIDGFEANYVGPSTRISIINGQYSSASSFIYQLLPLKIGKFQIPSLSIDIQGKTYTTEPIDIEVIDQQTSSSGQQDSQEIQLNLPERLFLKIEIPGQDVYLNQRIPLAIKLFIAGLRIEDVQFPELDFNGFTLGEFSEPQQYQQILNGVRYHVVEFDTFISPSRIGELLLGPVRVHCQIVSQNRRRERSNFDGFFNDDIFDHVFDFYEKDPYTIEAETQKLNVLPLPEEGKPQDFSPAVGNFEMEASVSPQEVKWGDPMTLKIHLSGQGNWKAIQSPVLKDEENFKLYDPQIKEQKKEMFIEQVIIPKTDQVKEIPAIHFSFFDPQLKQYKTLSQGPFPIKILPLEKQDHFSVIGLPEPAVQAPENLGRDIVFIKESPGRFRPQHRAVHDRMIWIGLYLITGSLWRMLWVILQRRKRFEGNERFRRRIRASQKARAGLTIAKTYLEKLDSRGFYNVLFKTMEEYLRDKFSLSMTDLSFELVNDNLKVKGIKLDGIRQKLRSILEECDMARFAGQKLDEQSMQRSYQALMEIIEILEKHKQ